MSCSEMSLDWKSVFWLFDLLLPAAKNLSINLCCSMFMWRHIKPQGMWNRHKQRWSRPLPGHTEGNRHAGLFIGSSKEKSYWKIWHTYDFHLSEEVKTIIKGKQKPTHFRNGKLNHQLPGNCWTLGCVHRTANVIARTLSTPYWKNGLFI